MTNVPLGGFTVQTADSGDGRVKHFHLTGKMEGTPGEYAFLETLRGSLTETVEMVALDFADVGYLNSSGVGVIVSCVTSARERNKNCCFIRVPDKIVDLFQVVGLFKLADVHDDLHAAMSAHLD